MTIDNEPCPTFGELWWVDFEYEDQPGKSKRRPAAVAAVRAEYGTVIVAKVTSHLPREGFEGELEIKDWKAAGLSKPSTIRCSKLMSIDIGRFAILERIGRLSDMDTARLRNAFYGICL